MPSIAVVVGSAGSVRSDGLRDDYAGVETEG